MSQMWKRVPWISMWPGLNLERLWMSPAYQLLAQPETCHSNWKNQKYWLLISIIPCCADDEKPFHAYIACATARILCCQVLSFALPSIPTLLEISKDTKRIKQKILSHHTASNSSNSWDIIFIVLCQQSILLPFPFVDAAIAVLLASSGIAVGFFYLASLPGVYSVLIG